MTAALHKALKQMQTAKGMRWSELFVMSSGGDVRSQCQRSENTKECGDKRSAMSLR